MKAALKQEKRCNFKMKLEDLVAVQRAEDSEDEADTAVLFEQYQAL